MIVTWVLVANDSGARLFESPALGKEFRPIRQFSHAAGRRKDRQIDADRPGRSFDKFGGGGLGKTRKQRHAMNREVRPHVHEQQVFAAELAAFLDKELSAQKFGQLALIAPAHFLGELRKALPEAVKQSVFKELHKDFPEWLKDHELIPHLHAELDI